MDDPVQLAIDALKSISRNEGIKAYLLANPPLYKTVLKAAMRFIGGETLEECFKTAKVISESGHSFTVDFMGESTRDEKTANEATEEFLKVINKISETKSKASISLDLSHIGMVIDKELGHKNAETLASKAQEIGIEMMISMEGIDRVDDILNEYERLSEKYPNVGITIQAYLHRTVKDLERVLKLKGKIRLVKGAYQADESVALPKGIETDDIYKKYIEMILKSNHPLSIATHDQKILEYIDTFVKENKINPDSFEIEMLYGASPDLLSEMHEKGYKTKDYLPYGKEWYLYFCHRLAENPLNIYQAIADAIN